jgi:gliding motility-associated-like protein
MNDYFDLSSFDVNQLEIYNRYGMRVYKQANYKKEWFGQTDGGEMLPDGTYYYVINLKVGEGKTGWIYINKQNNN